MRFCKTIFYLDLFVTYMGSYFNLDLYTIWTKFTFFKYSNTNNMNYLNLWYIYFCYVLLEVHYIHFQASPIFEEVTHHCEKNIDVRISSTRFKTWLQATNSLCPKKRYFNSYHLFNFLFFFSFFLSLFIYYFLFLYFLSFSFLGSKINFQRITFVLNPGFCYLTICYLKSF